MVLDSRSKEILQYLLTQYDYISVDALMKEFQISRRTTYYAIQKLNEWLQENRISEIEVERNKGIFLTSIQKNKIDEALYRENQKSEYAFSAEKRIQVMICLIIQSSEKITVEYLMKIFEVSRNTVFADLKEIGRILNEYHLTLSNEQKKDITYQAIQSRSERFSFFMSICFIH